MSRIGKDVGIGVAMAHSMQHSRGGSNIWQKVASRREHLVEELNDLVAEAGEHQIIEFGDTGT
jgi:hypothetical protein